MEMRPPLSTVAVMPVARALLWNSGNGVNVMSAGDAGFASSRCDARWQK